MKFSDFKREYRNLAETSVPDPLKITVSKSAKPELTVTQQSAFRLRAFRFTPAVICLLLAALISIGVINLATPFSKRVISDSNEPYLSHCKSYKEIEEIFSSKEDIKHTNHYIEWSGSADLGEVYPIVDESITEGNGNLKGDDSFSETNTQLEGVDEADIIKTDGRYIFYHNDFDLIVTDDEYGTYLKTKSIAIIDIQDPKNIKVLPHILINDYIEGNYNFVLKEMYLSDEKLTVIFTIYYRSLPKEESYPADLRTGVMVFDVSNPQTPSLLRYYTQDGSYNTSRRIGDYIYIVSNTSPSDFDGNAESVIPKIYDSAASAKYECIPAKNVYICDRNVRNFAIIGAVNTSNAKEDASVISALSSCDNLYSSASSIYIMSDEYGNPNDDLSSDYSLTTYIYKYNIDNSTITPVASACVKGRTLNQFSADEYKGYLRIATTSSNDNLLTILDENLNQVSQIDGLAEGEQIYSVRFTGDTGYVVTFRVVDPLFSFDLSDPKNPKLTGELKIPGFSEYLHPYSEDIMIGVGQNADENNGLYQGLKLSLFDVSDSTSPQEIFNLPLGNRGSYSEVETNHKAFAYYPDKDIFGIPATIYAFPDDGQQHHPSEHAPFSHQGFYIISLNDGKELKVEKIIQQLDENGSFNRIHRGIFIGDTVVTLSLKTIQTNDIATGNLLDSESF